MTDRSFTPAQRDSSPDFDDLLAALKRCREGLYNGFEPENQSSLYYDIDSLIKNAGAARCAPTTSGEEFKPTGIRTHDGDDANLLRLLLNRYETIGDSLARHAAWRIEDLLNERTARSALIHEKDCPKVWDFFKKHALGSLACPSCFACGHQSNDRADWWITHGELPDVYICKTCVEKLRSTVPSERTECSWNRVGGVYETSCGGDLAYEDTLQDCGVVYCQRCGGKVKDITNDE